jgi:hypothetical protein
MKQSASCKVTLGVYCLLSELLICKRKIFRKKSPFYMLKKQQKVLFYKQ